MSKSYDFCREVAQNALRSSFIERNWNNAIEIIETEAIFDGYLHGERKLFVTGVDDNGNDVSLNIDISFDANADFDYFTSADCIHDGTLLFIKDTIDRCIQAVCCGRTYYAKMEEPKSGDNLKYIVGNFVILNEYDGDFVPTDKPWLLERTTVLLPIKMKKE